MRKKLLGLVVGVLIALIPFVPIKKSNYDVPQTNGSIVHVIYDWMSLTEYLTGRQVEAFYVPTTIKSMQYGTVALSASSSNTAAITSVSTTNEVVSYLGWSLTTGVADGITQSGIHYHCTLTNATTVTCAGAGGQAVTGNVNFVVIEFRSGVLRSNTQYSVTATSTSTAKTITSVNIAKAWVVWQGDGLASISTALDSDCAWARVTLTSSTTVTQAVHTYNPGGCGPPISYFQIAEFF